MSSLQVSEQTKPLRRPQTFKGHLTDAFELAQQAQEPLFVPASYFTDDRGWSLMNQLQGVLSAQGQVNYSVMYPQVIKAWHRHHRQTDFWVVLHGHLKIGVHRESDQQSWLAVCGERNPGTLIIPPPLWHGAATVGAESAGLLYYVTHRYDPAAPDEDRQAYDFVPGFPWHVQHH